MSFLFSISKLFFLSAFVGFIVPFVISLFLQRTEWKKLASLLFALALVGACAGVAGGMSRSAAVGDIIPAFLGLLGAVAVYLFGVDQSRGVIASYGAVALSIALMFGYTNGAASRLIPEDHRDIRGICAKAYTDSELLGDDKAFERFQNRMGNLCIRSMNWHITPDQEKER